jgi:endonuclease G
MKRILILICMVQCMNIALAQDTVRLKHHNYVSVYSKSLHYPIIDEWWITRDKVNGKHLPRKDQFQKDPLLPVETDVLEDYHHSGYDRGHLSPAIDNETLGDSVLTECFFMSNMIPQPHSLNAGDWKSVETWSDDLAKKYDSIHVWAGGFGSLKKIGKVTVPKYCWKIIYIQRTKEYEVYLFNNIDVPQTGMNSHKVDIDDVQKLTGLKIKQ